MEEEAVEEEAVEEEAVEEEANQEAAGQPAGVHESVHLLDFVMTNEDVETLPLADRRYNHEVEKSVVFQHESIPWFDFDIRIDGHSTSNPDRQAESEHAPSGSRMSSSDDSVFAQYEEDACHQDGEETFLKDMLQQFKDGISTLAGILKALVLLDIYRLKFSTMTTFEYVSIHWTNSTKKIGLRFGGNDAFLEYSTDSTTCSLSHLIRVLRGDPGDITEECTGSYEIHGLPFVSVVSTSNPFPSFALPDRQQISECPTPQDILIHLENLAVRFVLPGEKSISHLLATAKFRVPMSGRAEKTKVELKCSSANGTRHYATLFIDLGENGGREGCRSVLFKCGGCGAWCEQAKEFAKLAPGFEACYCKRCSIAMFIPHPSTTSYLTSTSATLMELPCIVQHFEVGRSKVGRSRLAEGPPKPVTSKTKQGANPSAQPTQSVRKVTKAFDAILEGREIKLAAKNAKCVYLTANPLQSPTFLHRKWREGLPTERISVRLDRTRDCRFLDGQLLASLGICNNLFRKEDGSPTLTPFDMDVAPDTTPEYQDLPVVVDAYGVIPGRYIAFHVADMEWANVLHACLRNGVSASGEPFQKEEDVQDLIAAIATSPCSGEGKDLQNKVIVACVDMCNNLASRINIDEQTTVLPDAHFRDEYIRLAEFGEGVDFKRRSNTVGEPSRYDNKYRHGHISFPSLGFALLGRTMSNIFHTGTTNTKGLPGCPSYTSSYVPPKQKNENSPCEQSSNVWEPMLLPSFPSESSASENYAFKVLFARYPEKGTKKVTFSVSNFAGLASKPDDMPCGRPLLLIPDESHTHTRVVDDDRPYSFRGPALLTHYLDPTLDVMQNIFISSPTISEGFMISRPIPDTCSLSQQYRRIDPSGQLEVEAFLDIDTMLDLPDGSAGSPVIPRGGPDEAGVAQEVIPTHPAPTLPPLMDSSADEASDEDEDDDQSDAPKDGMHTRNSLPDPSPEIQAPTSIVQGLMPLDVTMLLSSTPSSPKHSQTPLAENSYYIPDSPLLPLSEFSNTPFAFTNPRASSVDGSPSIGKFGTEDDVDIRKSCRLEAWWHTISQWSESPRASPRASTRASPRASPRATSHGDLATEKFSELCGDPGVLLQHNPSRHDDLVRAEEIVRGIKRARLQLITNSFSSPIGSPIGSPL